MSQRRIEVVALSVSILDLTDIISCMLSIHGRKLIRMFRPWVVSANVWVGRFGLGRWVVSANFRGESSALDRFGQRLYKLLGL